MQSGRGSLQDKICRLLGVQISKAQNNSRCYLWTLEYGNKYGYNTGMHCLLLSGRQGKAHSRVFAFFKKNVSNIVSLCDKDALIPNSPAFALQTKGL